MKSVKKTLCLVVFLLTACSEPRYDNPFDPLAEGDKSGDQQYYEEITHTPMGSYGGDLGSGNIELRVEWVGDVNRVIWYKDNNQHWIDTDVSDNSSILRFDNLQYSDTGLYSYIVDFKEMGMTGRSQGYRVYINDDGGINKIGISGPDYKYVDEEARFEVEHIAGKTVEWIQWHFNDNPITGNPSAGMSALVIPSVQEFNEGKYFCKVKYQGDPVEYETDEVYLQVDVKNGIVFTKNIIDDGMATESDLINGAYQVYRVVGGEIIMDVEVVRTTFSNVSFEWYISSDEGKNWQLAGASSLSDIKINLDGQQCVVKPLKLIHSGKLFKCRVEGSLLTSGFVSKDSNIIRLIVEDGIA